MSHHVVLMNVCTARPRKAAAVREVAVRRTAEECLSTLGVQVRKRVAAATAAKAPICVSASFRSAAASCLGCPHVPANVCI